MQHKTFFSAIIAASALIFSCTREKEVIPMVPESPEPAAPEWIPGEMTLVFDRETADLLAADPSSVDLSEFGVESLKRIFPDAGRYEERSRREGLHRYYTALLSEDMPVTKASVGIADAPGVVKAAPRLPVYRRSFNDPYFSSQWHLVNTRYAGCDINVTKVWEEFTTGSPDVVVAVVDEGADMSHEDLNLVPASAEGSYNFCNDTPKVSAYEGHGTHVAGTICAVNNNGIGVASVAGGDFAAGKEGVKVLSCQIFDQFITADTDGIARAMKEAADRGAAILQCSWGYSPDMDADGKITAAEAELYRSFTIDDLPEYKAAIDYFIKYAGCDENGDQKPGSPMKGGVAIFAAGNDNFDWDPMVSYDKVIAVGAFGVSGNKASYSNYGTWVDVSAPGGDGNMGIMSTQMNNNYGGPDRMGTSFSCPQVSGVAALLVSYFGGPGFTAEECKARILGGAVRNAFKGARKIGKKLDAYGAFTFDLSTKFYPPVMSWTGTLPTEMAFNATADVPFSVSDPQGGYVACSVEPALDGLSVVEDATGYKLVVDALKVGVGSYTIKVVGTDEDDLASTLSLDLKILDNKAPVAVDKSLLLYLGDEPASVSVDGMFTDPEGEAVSVSMEKVFSVVSAELEGNSIRISPLEAGHIDLAVVGEDAHGMSSTAKVRVVVKSKDRPVDVFSSVVTTHLEISPSGASDTPLEVEIFSSTGQRVISSSGSGTVFEPFTVSVADLAPGVYKTVVTEAGTQHNLSFVKI